jgi:four helix bundle protein
LQELDETQYWLELISEAAIIPAKRLMPLQQEAEELIAILVTITKSVKRRGRARRR